MCQGIFIDVDGTYHEIFFPTHAHIIAFLSFQQASTNNPHLSLCS
jgi:hypothetical protein